MTVKFYSVYSKRYKSVYQMNIKLLYNLLAERTPEQSISHKQMPTMANHTKFVESQPYKEWLMIYDNEKVQIVGSIYVSKQDEIGLFIFKEHQGKGYGKEALSFILENNVNTIFYANINPQNYKSINLFKKFGFLWQSEKTIPGQYTYMRLI